MNPLRKLRMLLMDTLGFSKTEANGMIVLLLLVLLMAVIPRVLPLIPTVQLSASDAALDEWSKTLKAAISKREVSKGKNTPAESPMRGTFDPNTTPLEQMVAAGVPELIAKRMTLYREKGGRFRKPQDISKIYGMTPALTDRLLPHVRIADEKSPTYAQQPYTFAPEKIHTFELNTVAAEELQLIRGIGPYLSKSIVKYRDRLGGFHSYDQLKEIKGLSEEIIAEIQNRSTLVVNITPLDINSDSLKILLRHPYLDYNMARIIINYRKVHGNFERPEDLRGIKVMSDSLYQKLTPYLRQ